MSKSLDDFFSESDEKQERSKKKENESNSQEALSGSAGLSDSDGPSEKASSLKMATNKALAEAENDYDKQPPVEKSASNQSPEGEPISDSAGTGKEKDKSEQTVAFISSNSGTRLSLSSIIFRRPVQPSRLRPINPLELIETIRKIPGYSNRLVYVKEHVLPKNPNISKEELSILLAITVGEAAVLLFDAKRTS